MKTAGHQPGPFDKLRTSLVAGFIGRGLGKSWKRMAVIFGKLDYCKFIWQREYEPVKTVAVSAASDLNAPD